MGSAFGSTFGAPAAGPEQGALEGAPAAEEASPEESSPAAAFGLSEEDLGSMMGPATMSSTQLGPAAQEPGTQATQAASQQASPASLSTIGAVLGSPAASSMSAAALSSLTGLSQSQTMGTQSLESGLLGLGFTAEDFAGRGISSMAHEPNVSNPAVWRETLPQDIQGASFQPGEAGGAFGGDRQAQGEGGSAFGASPEQVAQEASAPEAFSPEAFPTEQPSGNTQVAGDLFGGPRPWEQPGQVSPETAREMGQGTHEPAGLPEGLFDSKTGEFTAPRNTGRGASRGGPNP